MRFGKFVVALGMASMLVAGSAFAAERGTPDEARVLVEKAAAHLKAVGAAKAFAGTMPAWNIAIALKDVDGKEFGKMIIAAAVGGGGWAEYRMANPATKKTEPKKTFAVQAGDYVLGSGAYNP